MPRHGGKVWYDDQREAHRQIYQGDETVDYAFMGADPLTTAAGPNPSPEFFVSVSHPRATARRRSPAAPGPAGAPPSRRRPRPAPQPPDGTSSTLSRVPVASA